MPDLFDAAAGADMTLVDYYEDFERHFWNVREFWKLERGQTFAEPGNASWEAFNQGDWDAAIRLLEERRESLIEYHRQADAAGVATRRIRIVEFPLSPYMQWELNLLRIRDETGGPIRVLDRSAVEHLETGGPLPEIYTLDDKIMYQAIYDQNGVLDYARKFTDPALVARARTFISGLYEQGAPIGPFFDRHVADLPAAAPPQPLRQDYLDHTGRPGPIRS